MLRAYLLILTCLFLSIGSQVEAENAHPASLARASSAPFPQDLEAIFAMAGQGDAGAQNYLGFLYATGQSVTKDEKTAFGWFHKAAGQGHTEALGNLGIMYEKGLGVAKNLRMAFALHRQAAMAGYPISMKRLASLYETGFVGEERDPVKAEMWKTRYMETLKTNPLTATDAAPRQAAEKALVTAHAEKSATLPESARTKPAPAAVVAAPRLPAPTQMAAAPPKAPVAPAMVISSQAQATQLLPAAPPAEKPITTAPAVTPPTQAAARKAEKPIAAAPIDKSVTRQPAPVVVVATAVPSTQAKSAPFSTAKTGASDKGKPHYIEVSGKATEREATELLQKIVGKGMLPKNMHVELVNPDADNYRIRIGPFADASDAAPQVAKINAAIKTSLAPSNTPIGASQELLPVVPARKQPIPAATAALPQKQEIAPAPIAPVTVPRVAPVASYVPAKLADEKPAADKMVRGRSYFILLNAKNTFEDSMFLTQFLFRKELVPDTHRVRIENLDGKNFHVSIGPFSDTKEANPLLLKISQQTFPESTSAKLEKHALVPVDGDDRPLIQINAQGTLDNAVILIQTLMEKELLTPKMFAEVVNLGAGNYRVRFGPFKGEKEGRQNIQNLKKQLKVFPILVNSAG
jgi:hypothetical protein